MWVARADVMEKAAVVSLFRGSRRRSLGLRDEREGITELIQSGQTTKALRIETIAYDESERYKVSKIFGTVCPFVHVGAGG